MDWDFDRRRRPVDRVVGPGGVSPTAQPSFWNVFKRRLRDASFDSIIADERRGEAGVVQHNQCWMSVAPVEGIGDISGEERDDPASWIILYELRGNPLVLWVVDIRPRGWLLEQGVGRLRWGPRR